MEKENAILIQGAMEVEIHKLKDSLKDIEKKTVDGYEFYIGKLEGNTIVISKTEVGIINSAVATMIGIKNFHPILIINQGTAGGYGKRIHKGDIIIGENCLNINSYKTPYRNKEEGSDSLSWELQTFNDGEDYVEKIESDANIIKFIKKHEKNIWDENVLYGTIGSGDCWNREMDRIEYLNKEYGILCEDMETIGVYKIAQRYNVPAIGIRVIADNEMLDEEYDRSLADITQIFAISLCGTIYKERKI